MIIDPYKNGVQIFTDSNITSIKGGNVIGICQEIYKRVTIPREDISGRIVYDQIYELHMDIGGIGIAYKDCLENMGLKISDMRYKNVDAILPIRNEGYQGGYIEKIMDIRPTFF